MAIDRVFQKCRNSFPASAKKVNPIVRMEYYQYRTDVIAKDLLVLQMRGTTKKQIIFFKTDVQGQITKVMSVIKSRAGLPLNPKTFYKIDWKYLENIIYVAEHWQQKSSSRSTI